jgi:hypothetical protein
MALALFRTLSVWMVVNHPLTLDGLRSTPRLAALRRNGYCVCYTLYLVFKEPDPAARPARRRFASLHGAARNCFAALRPRCIPTQLPLPTVSGEPCEITIVRPFSSSSRVLRRAKEFRTRAGRAAASSRERCLPANSMFNRRTFQSYDCHSALSTRNHKDVAVMRARQEARGGPPILEDDRAEINPARPATGNFLFSPCARRRTGRRSPDPRSAVPSRP